MVSTNSMYTTYRVAPRLYRASTSHPCLSFRQFSSSRHTLTAKPPDAAKTDPRLAQLGTRIHDEYAHIKDHYETPRNPIVLAHGLLGFAELRLLPSWLPPVYYWRGITEALKANGVEVITTTVPPSGRIEKRAEELARGISDAANGREVNIIAHSMGGLDARYMISHLRPTNVKVRSLVTVASPHHGSSFADFLFQEIGNDRLPEIYRFLERVGMETGAFEQLTSTYMNEKFNPNTPDDPDVRYFSYGASTHRLPLLSPFRQSLKIISRIEGPNDGLVSVTSSQWGSYKGTLVNVSHLDLINWTNRWRWMIRGLMGITPGFNAVAFYLGVADMLAKEGF